MTKEEPSGRKPPFFVYIRKHRVSRKFLERYERDQAFPPNDAPGSSNQRLIERINPEVFVNLLQQESTSLENHLNTILSPKFSLTVEVARTILSTINTLPLLTQHLLLSVGLRTNTAIRHCKAYHGGRADIDRGQRGDPVKRALWWYKLSKGEPLPFEAGLWEMGTISRRAFKGTRKMSKLMRRLVKKGRKVKKWSGKCAFWMRKMGVEEERAMKMVFDPVTGEWRRYEPRVPTSNKGQDGIGRSNFQGSGDIVQQRDETHPQIGAGSGNLEPNGIARSYRKDTSSVNAEYDSDSEWISDDESDHTTDEFQSTPLETVPEERDEETAAESSYFASLLSTKTTSSDESNLRGRKQLSNSDNNRRGSMSTQLTTPEVSNTMASTQATTPDMSTLTPNPQLHDRTPGPTSTRKEAQITVTTSINITSTPKPLPLYNTERPPPDRPYETAYWQPTITSSILATSLTEADKSLVNREHLWNPPPRYLSGDAQRFVLHSDRKCHIRHPEQSKRKVDATRRKEAFEKRKKEAKERYKRETNRWKRWWDRWRGKKVAVVAVEDVWEDEVVDEKSEAYASMVSQTRRFGRKNEGEEGRKTPTVSAAPRSSSSEVQSASGDRSSPEIEPFSELQLATQNQSEPEVQSSPEVQLAPSTPQKQASPPPPSNKKPGVQITHPPTVRRHHPLTSKLHSIFILTKQRPLFHHRTSHTKPPRFAPRKAYLRRLKKSMRTLVKARNELVGLYEGVEGFMDEWEGVVDSGEAWSGGRERGLPGFAEGTRCMGEESAESEEEEEERK